MTGYPYTTVPGKISELFKRIKDTGVPAKATQTWLKSIGFTSSNDRSLLPILTFIGFIDSSGIPTEQWRRYRGSNGRQVLAECIKRGYEGLFSTYLDAHNRDKSELSSFFSTHSSAGQQAISKTISTFQALCKLADFGTIRSQGEKAVDEEPEEAAGSIETIEEVSRSHKGLAININIQLTLPETTDEKVYDAFFSAMKRHLLQGEN